MSANEGPLTTTTRVLATSLLFAVVSSVLLAAFGPSDGTVLTRAAGFVIPQFVALNLFRIAADGSWRRKAAPMQSAPPWRTRLLAATLLATALTGADLAPRALADPAAAMDPGWIAAVWATSFAVGVLITSFSHRLR